MFESVVNVACGDLDVFTKKDPAANNDSHRVAHAYSSYRAVLHYRLAHALATSPECRDLATAEELDANAHLISCRGKLLSGAEIHHRCSIGLRFILDHGYGTVIGETTRIGDDCYVLGSVTLGATGIAGNPAAKRHPTIGNRVQIGAFSRIFGPVTIGDDVFIGPHCVIKEDIPSGSTVMLKTALQITRTERGVFQMPAARPAAPGPIQG
ncbi:serine O-acetyltransferase [Azospirillum thermophilum]|uniref:serine O-acetyltransferase n=1 Tax=Azospirillum thermophilum TaxID=2202148 RepID=UPI001B3BB605|nr:serine O-acetyltransferase [Azospirillum thermophilum]